MLRCFAENANARWMHRLHLECIVLECIVPSSRKDASHDIAQRTPLLDINAMSNLCARSFLYHSVRAISAQPILVYFCAREFVASLAPMLAWDVRDQFAGSVRSTNFDCTAYACTAPHHEAWLAEQRDTRVISASKGPSSHLAMGMPLHTVATA